MEKGTDPKSETPIRSAIKFATKAVKTPYLYVESSKSYEHQHQPTSGLKKNDDNRKEENLMKNYRKTL